MSCSSDSNAHYLSGEIFLPGGFAVDWEMMLWLWSRWSSLLWMMRVTWSWTEGFSRSSWMTGQDLTVSLTLTGNPEDRVWNQTWLTVHPPTAWERHDLISTRVARSAEKNPRLIHNYIPVAILHWFSLLSEVCVCVRGGIVLTLGLITNNSSKWKKNSVRVSHFCCKTTDLATLISA